MGPTACTQQHTAHNSSTQQQHTTTHCTCCTTTQTRSHRQAPAPACKRSPAWPPPRMPGPLGASSCRPACCAASWSRPRSSPRASKSRARCTSSLRAACRGYSSRSRLPRRCSPWTLRLLRTPRWGAPGCPGPLAASQGTAQGTDSRWWVPVVHARMNARTRCTRMHAHIHTYTYSTLMPPLCHTRAVRAQAHQPGSGVARQDVWVARPE